MFENYVYPRLCSTEFKSVGYGIDLFGNNRNFRIHVETGLRYSAFGEVLSQIYDGIYRFIGKQLSRLNRFAERVYYRVKFNLGSVLCKRFNSRSREQFCDLFEYQVYPSIGCAEFESIGYRVKFSCYLRNFRIHVETGLRYSTFGEVLSKINDCINRFAREQFGCFEYFTERTDYRVEFKFFRVAHKGLYGRSREQFRDLFKHAVYTCVGCAEFESIGNCVKFLCYLRNFRIHIETGLRYSAFGEVLSKVYDCINRFIGKQLSRLNRFAERVYYRVKFNLGSVLCKRFNSRSREQFCDLFEYQVYPSIGCAEFESIGYRVKFSCYLRNFRIHVETGLRYSTFGEVLSKINDCINRFAREQFGCFEYFTERTDYRVEFKFFRVAHKGLYGRSREQFRDLFKHAVYICVGCAEFKPIGNCIEFSCYLGDFRIHIETGLRYSAFGEVLRQIYDCINSFFGE